MKKPGIAAKTTAMLCILLTAAAAMLPGGSVWGAPGQAIPPPTLQPLNQIAVPEPQNLFQFVKNEPAAIRLGKALFWDMQAGSDGVQACGSCHFSAGADNRRKNTVNPGIRGGDTTFQVRGPNETLLDSDFPFHQRQDPDFQASQVLRDSNDIVGSQGVRFTDFVAINAGSAVDNGASVPDPVFQAGGVNMRRVTARNTPTNINAVFNFVNFWDGRAHFLFNGVNPFGPLDPNAGVFFNQNNTLVKQKVAIDFASLASQATGPPLDDVEMSFRGRTFPQLGRKMLGLTPLGKQFVHPNDSVLGTLSRATLQPDGKLGGNPGINATYAQMIRDAFVNNLWDNSVQLTPDGFSQMEANFSLFWGLAIQLYEATLVSDQTPFDRFLGGDRTALTPQQQDGFNIFFGAGKCDVCHGGSEMTNASVGFARFLTNSENALIEQVSVASGRQIIYDDAFNNTAVRPTTDDIGRGGTAPFINPLTSQPFPLSFVRLAELQATGSLPFATPILPAQLPANFPTGADGFFKVPGLRNVELTAPYMHNGGMRTLEEVVDFYTRGGDFPAANIDNLDINITQIGTLQNAPNATAALVEFMKSFTDERVRNESAPFDHPEILIPNGDPEVLIRIPARDATGTAALPSNFRINPVVSPTRTASQIISGTKDAGTIEINLNGQPLTPVTATDTTWSVTVTGLIEGNNVITITTTDPPPTSATTTTTVTITLDTIPPALTLNAVSTPTRVTAQTLSGTVETGVNPAVAVGTVAAAPVTVAGGNWITQLSSLAVGPNTVTVTATDPAGNVTTRTTSIMVLGNGVFKGTGTPDVSDALKALRMAVGLITPTADDLLHGDVAPLGAPDGIINIADALLIMRNVVGSISLITN